VLRDGVCYFQEGASGELVDDHPLTGAFGEILELERRKNRLRMRYPSWLHGPAERLMQFASEDGTSYFYDFGVGRRLPGSLLTIMQMALAGEVGASGFEVGEPAAKSEGSPLSRSPGLLIGGADGNGGFDKSKLSMSQADAAAAAVLAVKIAERADLKEEARMEAMNQGGFSKLIGRQMMDSVVHSNQKEAGLRSSFHEALHLTYDPLMSSSLVHAPRPLRATLDCALALGIDIVREPEYLWLADLARSLPVPIGWGQAKHPSTDTTYFWHNELTATSQWQHPVDEFVKATVSTLRSPLHPRAMPHLEANLGEKLTKQALA